MQLDSVSLYEKSFESCFHLKMKWTQQHAGWLHLNGQESRGEQLLSNPVNGVQ